MKKVIAFLVILGLLAVPVLAEEKDSKEGKSEHFWNWCKDNKEMAKDLDEAYKENPKLKDDGKSDDKADARKMFWLLNNAEKHPKLAEKMFEWADNHPVKAKWLFDHPKAAGWLMTHPRAAEFLGDHPGIAKRFEHRVEFAKWLNNHPGLKDKVGKHVEKAGEQRENRGEKLENRGENMQEKGEEIGGKKGKILEKKGEQLENKGERMQNQGERMQNRGEKMQRGKK